MSDLITLPDVPLASDATDEVAQLQAEIASKRQRLAGSLEGLRHQWQEATSWRQLISRPVVWLGVGVCLGFLVGYAAGPARRRR